MTLTAMGVEHSRNLSFGTWRISCKQCRSKCLERQFGGKVFGRVFITIRNFTLPAMNEIKCGHVKDIAWQFQINKTNLQLSESAEFRTILILVPNTMFIVSATYVNNTTYETGVYGVEEKRSNRALSV